LAPVWPQSGTLSGPRSCCVRADARKTKKNKKNKIYILFFWVVVASWKREEKIFRFSVFNPQDPQDPQFPELRGLCGQSREKKKVFSI
jgi:hypothetical protein